MTATRALLVGTALIAVVALFAACSGGGAAASASPPPGVDVSIDAKDIAFSTSTLNVRAGQPFKPFFRNLDAPRTTWRSIETTLPASRSLSARRSRTQR
jgi:hypothetical protein